MDDSFEAERRERRFDRQLADVRVPDDLQNRLRAIARWDDATLDHAMRDVDAPVGLLSRCRSIAAESWLERRLNDLPVPEELMVELRKIPAETPSELDRRARRFMAPRGVRGGLASLASLLLGIVLPLLYLGDRLAELRALHPAPIVHVLTHPEWNALRGTQGWSLEDGGALSEIVMSDDSSNTDAAGTAIEIDDSSSWVAAFDPIEFDAPDMLTDREYVRRWIAGSRLMWTDLAPKYSIAQDLLVARRPILGAPRRDNELPIDLDWGTPPERSGMVPPLLPGFDRAFLFRHRVNPLVAPRDDARLAELQVPVVTTSANWDWAWERLRLRGQLQPDDVCVEEFLAAMRYGWEPSTDGVRVRMAAAGTPFAENNGKLLQIGLQAGRQSDADFEPSHTTILLDASESMRCDGRWSWGVRALLRALDELGPGREYTLLLCGNQCFPIASSASHDDLPQLRQVLSRIVPQGDTDLVHGLQAGIEHARSELSSRHMTRRLLVITDAEPPTESDGWLQIAPLLDECVQEGLSIGWMNLNGHSDKPAVSGGQRGVTPPRLQRTNTPGSDSLRRAVWQFVSQRSSEAARRVSLRVRFDPAEVAAYRLIGHNATSYGGLLPASEPVTLHRGDQTSVLFEIWLDPRSPGGGRPEPPPGEASAFAREVATAEVRWIDPSDGSVQIRLERLYAHEIASTFEAAAPALRFAGVVAEAAEILRESYFVPVRSRGFREVSQIARRLPKPLQSSAEMADFVEFLRLADPQRSRAVP